MHLALCIDYVYSRPVPDAPLQIVSPSTVPAYRQIVDQIRFHLHRGALSPGDPLPSVRGLATQLGVHFNTVAEAYRELASEGWIDLRQGKRAIARTPGVPVPLPAAEADGLIRRLRHLVAEMRLKGIDAGTIQSEIESVLGR